MSKYPVNIGRARVKSLIYKGAILGIVILLCLPRLLNIALAHRKVVKFAAFGHVHIYQQGKAQKIVLVLSGDRGWDQGAVDAAHALSEPGTLVAGIDTALYLRSMGQQAQCGDVGNDLKHLGKFLEKRYRFDHYAPPTLVGYSSGASLVYAALLQEYPQTFSGGLSLDFCPSLSLAKPFCNENELTASSNMKANDTTKQSDYTLNTVKAIPNPWITFQNPALACSASQNGSYWKGVGNAQSFAVSGDQQISHEIMSPLFQDSFHKILATQTRKVSEQDVGLDDLPLKERPANTPKNKPLIVLITGDGGWVGMDDDLSHEFNNNGISVVGIDSLRYFWEPKSPERASQDLGRLLTQYGQEWNPSSVMIVGYSRGANAVPFMITRLPEPQKKQIKTLVLLSPSQKAKFYLEFSNGFGRYLGALHLGKIKKSMHLLPEVEKLGGLKILCFYGKEDEREGGSLCPLLNKDKFKVIEMPGGHHFDQNYKSLAQKILREAGP